MALPFALADESLAQFDCVVDGASTAARSGRRFDVVDPGSGRVWTSCPECGPEDADAAVAAARKAFAGYSRWTPRQRAELLLRWERRLADARDDLARLLVHETGKPLAEARGEVDFALGLARWFAGEAERMHGSTAVAAAPGRRVVVVKQPVGVVVGLVPWNFPLVLALRKAAAALAAGCAVVLKPAPETPATALALARLALAAGLPAGALNVLTTSGAGTPALAEALCRHPLVAKVTFTGSSRVGRVVAELCARALVPTTLELGGNAPFIVFADARLDHAVAELAALKWRHAGQVCVAANRVYVERGIHDALVDALVARCAGLRPGHGMAPDTTMGPLTTARGLARAEDLARDALARGATAVLGTGRRCADGGGGYHMAPTILTGVTDDMRMSREEVFAPLLGLSVFDSEDEVVARANDTTMGLASYVFTKDVDRLWRMFEKLETGVVGLNTGGTSSAEAPFGGIKHSGWGKESGKEVAVDEFMVTKSGTLTVDGHW